MKELPLPFLTPDLHQNIHPLPHPHAYFSPGFFLAPGAMSSRCRLAFISTLASFLASSVQWFKGRRTLLTLSLVSLTELCNSPTVVLAVTTINTRICVMPPSPPRPSTTTRLSRCSSQDNLPLRLSTPPLIHVFLNIIEYSVDVSISSSPACEHLPETSRRSSQCRRAWCWWTPLRS